MFSYSEDPLLAGEVAAAGAEVAGALGTEAKALALEGETDADSAAGVIGDAARAGGFRALLIGETRWGTVVAAKVAARLGVGCLGKGRGLRVEGERLVTSRDVYGGRFLARVGARMPCVALVQQGSYRPAASPVRVEGLRASSAVGRVSTVRVSRSEEAAQDIKSASRIVSAGRGFAKEEDLALARDLADALGAALGCSRPLSSDLGWMREDQHIGLTGAYVHPALYVAVGISGQPQHLAGMRDSKVVVAINKDGQAPIFQAADYGIVGDLYEVLPALTRALRDL